MESEPDKAYVYQPDPKPPHDADPRIFAIGGRRSERYSDRRFTRSDAEKIVAFINSLPMSHQ